MATSRKVPRCVLENRPTIIKPNPESADYIAKCRRNAQLEKCAFFADVLNYLGHFIRS